jgi:hypothetical protein
VRQVAELLAHDEGTPSLAEQAAFARAVGARARALSAGGTPDPRYAEVVDTVSTYVAARRALGLTETQVARGASPLDARRALRGLGLAVLAPLALLGAALYAIPYRLPRLATRLARGEADVVSTYKLAIGLVAFPAWAATLLAGTLVFGRSLTERLGGAALALAAPLAALVWIDRLDDRRGRRLLEVASAAGRRSLARVRLLRRRALDAIGAAREP